MGKETSQPAKSKPTKKETKPISAPKANPTIAQLQPAVGETAEDRGTTAPVQTSDDANNDTTSNSDGINAGTVLLWILLGALLIGAGVGGYFYFRPRKEEDLIQEDVEA